MVVNPIEDNDMTPFTYTNHSLHQAKMMNFEIFVVTKFLGQIYVLHCHSKFNGQLVLLLAFEFQCLNIEIE